MAQTQPITPLRQRMLDDMKLRNMAVEHAQDLRVLGRRLQRLPRPLAGPAHARGRARLPAAPGRPRAQGQQHLPDHERLALLLRHHARQTARRRREIPLPRKADPLPAILSPDEVKRLLTAVPDRQMRTLLTTVYAAGLRVSEVVGLQVGDIDSARMTIHVREGKGGRDRYVMLSPQLLAILRAHWRRTRPPLLAVPGAGPVPADHGALGAAGLLPGGRDRRARQVGDRAHPAAQLRHPPARAGRRHPGDPALAGASADHLDDALRPGRPAHDPAGAEPARAARPRRTATGLSRLA